MEEWKSIYFRRYFIALLEEWKSIGFASQCLCSTFSSQIQKKDQSLARRESLMNFYNVIVTLHRRTLVFIQASPV